MTRTRSLGLWIIAVGLILQAVGLGCDALLHHQDPTLSQRESALGTDSLTHVVVVLGLAVMGAGAVVALLPSRGSGRRVPRTSALSLAPGATMAVVLLVAGAASFISGDIPTTHSHGGAAHALAGTEDEEGHQHDDPAKLLAESPTARLLKQTVEQEGTEAALAKLEQLAANDRTILENSHSLVHLIGRTSFDHYGSAAVAFQHCKQTFESGCYHGVLEGYLKQSTTVKSEDVAALCETAAGTGEQRANLRFQCVHGMGHGLSLFFDHDLNRALTYCDFLATEWDRTSCYGGAFMENVVAAHEVMYGIGGNKSAAALRRYLRADDPQFPCNAVAEKYQNSCYHLQTSAFLLLNGQDFKAAFNQCDRTPAQHVWICYQSMGRDVISTVLWDLRKAYDLCSQGNPQYVEYCYAGVVANLIGVDWKFDTAFEFCGLVQESGKKTCYTSVGYQVAVLYATDADRVRVCGGAPAAFASVCIGAARAYTTS